jgi:N-acetylglucosamine kinase-like BadF-type ATPase
MSGALVGIDVGGTKTHLQAVSAKGELIAEAVRPSGEWRRWPNERKAPWLASLIGEIVGDGAQATSVAVGAHGCDNAAQCDALQAALAPLIGVSCVVVNDAELLSPALGAGPAIGVISGTGSKAVGPGPEGEPLYVGGWGWLLGDEGGGAGLVRHAAQELLDLYDQNDRDERLAFHLLSALGAADVADIPEAMTSVVPEAWAQHAPAVFAAAREGSPAARRVIADGGQSLAKLVGGLRERGVATALVVASGGVITSQPDLAEAFRAALAKLDPTFKLRILEVPPVTGAVALARAALRSAGPSVASVSPVESA